MSHPARLEDSSQTHHATKDHHRHCKNSMSVMVCRNYQPEPELRGQKKIHFKQIIRRTDYNSVFPRNIRDWNNLSLPRSLSLSL